MAVAVSTAVAAGLGPDADFTAADFCFSLLPDPFFLAGPRCSAAAVAFLVKTSKARRTLWPHWLLSAEAGAAMALWVTEEAL